MVPASTIMHWIARAHAPQTLQHCLCVWDMQAQLHLCIGKSARLWSLALASLATLVFCLILAHLHPADANYDQQGRPPHLV
jgi:hypothetical protein